MGIRKFMYEISLICVKRVIAKNRHQFCCIWLIFLVVLQKLDFKNKINPKFRILRILYFQNFRPNIFWKTHFEDMLNFQKIDFLDFLFY